MDKANSPPTACNIAKRKRLNTVGEFDHSGFGQDIEGVNLNSLVVSTTAESDYFIEKDKSHNCNVSNGIEMQTSGNSVTLCGKTMSCLHTPLKKFLPTKVHVEY